MPDESVSSIKTKPCAASSSPKLKGTIASPKRP